MTTRQKNAFVKKLVAQVEEQVQLPWILYPEIPEQIVRIVLDAVMAEESKAA